MKTSNFKSIVLTGILSLGLLNVSCNKEEPTPNDDTTDNTDTGSQNDPCNGGDGFCMTYKGDVKSGDASLFVYNGSKVRVYWENGENASFEQVELDIYGLAPGTYDVNDLATPGSAFLQYFSSADGTNNAAYGTVEVTALDTNGVVTGTFDLTMKDSTKIIDGKFTNISK